jgi:hypothetical protein
MFGSDALCVHQRAIAHIELREPNPEASVRPAALTDYCRRVIGSRTLLDKVGSGMLAKPRS